MRLLLVSVALMCAACAAQDAVPLPAGVTAEWSLERAAREATATRERVCLNGLWRWQPGTAEAPPRGEWGWFKVPGPWPGSQDYLRSDYQTLWRHPRWGDVSPAELSSAWYEREFTVPAEWPGRRIALAADLVNSLAEVHLDGAPAGAIRFPDGELELPGCRPGATHRLSIRVTAMPLRAVMLSFGDTNAAREVRGTVERRGLCGDLWLVATSPGPRLADVRVLTSLRAGRLTVSAAGEASANEAYQLRARIREGDQLVREFAGPAERRDGRLELSVDWLPEKRWDLHTPQHQYDLELTLLDAGGRVLDVALPVRFGVRELWIEGRDFYLNGTRLWLSAVPLDNAQIGSALSTYDAALESFRRLQSYGINFVYTHNYGCEPGSHLAFEAILRAADDAGMLVALSQPHFGVYDWQAADADTTNGYAAHAAYYCRVAGSHPSVVSYSTSHNATGYSEDMNPDLIDGTSDPRPTQEWAQRGPRTALRAQAIIERLDPSRLVYHHSSGNLGNLHTSNFYPNFVPIQELDDWFEHWATVGVKPVFTVEFGAPFGWDWTMYRGWYNGQREFGSAAVPWEYCLAEWNAQFLGDEAYATSPREAANVRWEAGQFAAGRLWRRWDYPTPVGERTFDEMQPVQAAYTTANLRAFRTWGVSATSPWEHHRFWKLRDGADVSRQNLRVDWANLQRPGYSPDFIERTYQRFDVAYQPFDWVPTPTAESLVRNNRPLLAWIAGPGEGFTRKDHNHHPGETVAKQLILINNSRQTATARIQWRADLPRPLADTAEVSLPTGEQRRLPIAVPLPAGLAPGRYVLGAQVRWSTGETQDDSFAIDVLPRPEPLPAPAVAIFDPLGDTARELAALGVAATPVEAGADLSGVARLVIGRGALTLDGPCPDLGRVRDGLDVIVFEQTAAALERRLGFRVAEYGLRQLFARVPDHPLLAGVEAAHLRDWRGAATLVPPRLTYTLDQRKGPVVSWCGIDVPRLWRCGNQGSLASVLIEKPARGDFLPLLDGGYALQYSPLLEYREGRGRILFCQLDLTARTERDPAAERLLRNLLAEPPRPREAPAAVRNAGDEAGRAWLEAAGFVLGDGLRVVGPGARLEAGPALALGLEQGAAPITTRRAEHLAATFAPSSTASLLRGVAPADVHCRDPRELPLVTGGARVIGNGVLAESEGVVYCQLVPWSFKTTPMNQKRTFRRVSCLVTRLLCNLGAASATPLLERFAAPVAEGEQRYLTGLYLDQPEEWDDPYRFFRW